MACLKRGSHFDNNAACVSTAVHYLCDWPRSVDKSQSGSVWCVRTQLRRLGSIVSMILVTVHQLSSWLHCNLDKMDSKIVFTERTRASWKVGHPIKRAVLRRPWPGTWLVFVYVVGWQQSAGFCCYVRDHRHLSGSAQQWAVFWSGNIL